MMGMQTAPAQLFYDFCLDDHVPDDHLLRRIDRFLDLEKVRSLAFRREPIRPKGARKAGRLRCQSRTVKSLSEYCRPTSIALSRPGKRLRRLSCRPIAP